MKITETKIVYIIQNTILIMGGVICTLKIILVLWYFIRSYTNLKKKVLLYIFFKILKRSLLKLFKLINLF